MNVYNIVEMFGIGKILIKKGLNFYLARMHEINQKWQLRQYKLLQKIYFKQTLSFSTF